MHIQADWIAPRECPMLTDLEFILNDGEHIMVSWESATFDKRQFNASGVSTTDSQGKVSTGNLSYLKDNIKELYRVHYLTVSSDNTCVKDVTFIDQVKGHYKSETWTFVNPKFYHHI